MALLLTVPNQFGVDDNAHAINSILKFVAPELGWRRRPLSLCIALHASPDNRHGRLETAVRSAYAARAETITITPSLP